MMDERFPLDNGQDMTNHRENCTRTSSEVSFCPAAIQDGLFTYFFSPAGFFSFFFFLAKIAIYFP